MKTEIRNPKSERSPKAEGRTYPGRCSGRLIPNSEIGEPAWPRMWLDVPRVQRLCARTLSNHPELLRAFAIFREGAENSTRGARAPQATSESGCDPNSEIGGPAWPRMWLDMPRVQPLCARTLSNHPELLRAFAIFREGAENSTRGARAPQATSESGLIAASFWKKKAMGLPLTEQLRCRATTKAVQLHPTDLSV